MSNVISTSFQSPDVFLHQADRTRASRIHISTFPQLLYDRSTVVVYDVKGLGNHITAFQARHYSPQPKLVHYFQTP